jgi:hypothetical protein
MIHRRLLITLYAAALGVCLSAPGVASGPPPGFNVHSVQSTPQSRFWRGGAPRKDTMEALVREAKSRGVTVTFVDLRTPPNSDDRSGKAGRLSPAAEAALAKKLGARYVAISALDKQLPARLKELRRQGDVYMHCMYGVNRTGFAAARYARATGAKISTEGLGKRDWKQGDAFQARLSGK